MNVKTHQLKTVRSNGFSMTATCSCGWTAERKISYNPGYADKLASEFEAHSGRTTESVKRAFRRFVS
jgi:hypothetical protein